MSSVVRHQLAVFALIGSGVVTILYDHLSAIESSCGLWTLLTLPERWQYDHPLRHPICPSSVLKSRSIARVDRLGDENRTGPWRILTESGSAQARRPARSQMRHRSNNTARRSRMARRFSLWICVTMRRRGFPPASSATSPVGAVGGGVGGWALLNRRGRPAGATKSVGRRDRPGASNGARLSDNPLVLLEPGAPIDAVLQRLKKRMTRAGVLREPACRRAGVTVTGRRKLKARRAFKRFRRDALRANEGTTDLRERFQRAADGRDTES
jgi:ribosomal protein S21